ncbi:MAG: glycoside hydrolase family 32 protein [Bryobacteraceae bacterium]
MVGMVNPQTRRTFLQASALGLAATHAVGAETNPLIVRAMEGVRAAIPTAENDPLRPVYHFHAPAQWINDPNGTIQYRGWYHMFYQHNPYGSKWGNMHWGHARSRDLVNWEHLPIAIAPSKEKGEEHVFSGCACLGPDGRPVVFYTSIGDGNKRDPEQWMAVPKDDDLISWDKHPANPILTTKLHKQPVNEWRDPFVFRDGGKTYMVCGGNSDVRGGHGEVQLYEAKNRELTKWEHRGAMLRDPDRTVWNVECPNFFKLDGKWVLLTSPHRPCEYFVGDFDASTPLFTPRRWGVLDPGAAYASNMIFDDKGRSILLLWSNTQTAEEKGWCGAMAIPRLLSIGEDGHLKQAPVPELAALRGDEIAVKSTALEGTPVALGLDTDTFEMEVTLEAKDAKAVGLTVSGTEVVFDPRSGYVTVGGKQIFAGRDKRVSLRVFLDKRMLEVFAAGTVVVHLMEPGAPGVQAFAREGSGMVRAGKAWPMKPATFSMTGYKV